MGSLPVPPHAAMAVAAASAMLGGGLARAANDAYSPDATSGLFSTSFTLGTTTPAAGGASAPLSGDALFFGPLTTGVATVSNDLSGYLYTGLTFNVGAPAFTISGNAFTLSGNVTVAAVSTQTLNTAIAVASGQNSLNLAVASAGLTLNGNLTGSGTLSQTGFTSGVTGLTLGGDNSGFTGAFTQDNAASTRTAFSTASAGSAGAAWTFNRAVGGGVALNFAANTISFGSLAGGAFVRNNVAGTDVLRVGDLNTFTTFSGQIQTNGTSLIALQKVGTGSLELTGANSYTGFTNVSNGTLIVDGGGTLGGGGTALTLGDATANTVGTLQLGTATAVGTATVVSLATAGTGTSNAIVGGNAGVSTLTLNNTTAVTIGTLIGGAGTNQNNLGLSKIGTGTLTVTGANSYSGPTQVSAGNLTFSASGGVASSAVTLGTVGGGATVTTLNITPSATAATNTRGASLTINGSNLTGNNGRNVTITGAAAVTTEQFTGALNLSSGGLFPNVVSNASGSTALSFGSLTRNAGTVINLGLSGTAIGATAATNLVFMTAPALVGSGGAAGSPTLGVLPYVFVNNGIGTYDSTVGVRNLNTTTEMTALASGMTAGQNAKLGGNLTLTADTSVNSLSLAVTTAGTLSFASDTTTLSVSSGAVSTGLNFSVGSGTVGGNGILNFGSAEGFLHVANARGLTINSAVAGSGGLTLDMTNVNASTSNVVLNGTNTYTGKTTFIGNNTALTVRLTNSLALQNSTLDYNNYGASFTFGNGGTTGLTGYTFGGLRGFQNINLNNNNTTVGAVALTIGSVGSADTYSTVNTYGGVLSNTVAGGSIAKAGVATQVLSGTNTYGGGTTVSGGTLVASNATSSFGSGATIVNAGGTVAGGTVAVPGATGAGGVSLAGGTITAGTGALSSNAVGTLIVGNSSATPTTLAQTASSTYAAKIDGTRSLVPTGQAPNSGLGTVYTGGSDQLILSGLSLTGGTTLTVNPTVVSTGSLVAGTRYDFVIADAKGSATAFSSLLSQIPSQITLSTTSDGSGTYALDYASDGAGGQALLLDFTPTAAPEPTSLLLAGLCSAPLVLARRRRMQSGR